MRGECPRPPREDTGVCTELLGCRKSAPPRVLPALPPPPEGGWGGVGRWGGPRSASVAKKQASATLFPRFRIFSLVCGPGASAMGRSPSGSAETTLAAPGVPADLMGGGGAQGPQFGAQRAQPSPWASVVQTVRWSVSIGGWLALSLVVGCMRHAFAAPPRCSETSGT